ncbi:MAG: hypothetical protein ACOCUV_01345 [bacterium]
MNNFSVPQDLHIHTTFSSSDSSVVPEQTPELVKQVQHADIMGISDHFDCLYKDKSIESYFSKLRLLEFMIGTELNGASWVDAVLEHDFDYLVYHCWDKESDYKAIDKLLDSGKPIIIAHPYALGTKLNKVPTECLIEINNRYIFRYDWKKYLGGFLDSFKFVFSSDAHQPNWLNQNVARYVGRELNIAETILFKIPQHC